MKPTPADWELGTKIQRWSYLGLGPTWLCRWGAQSLVDVCINAIKHQTVAFDSLAKIRAEFLAGKAQKWWWN